MDTSQAAVLTNSQPSFATRRDYLFGTVAGLIIGLLLLPILQTAKPDLYLSLRFILVPVFIVLTLFGLVIASWLATKLRFIWQLAKFVVIGGMNTLVDLGIFAFLAMIAAGSASQVASTDTWFHVGSVTVMYYSLYKACSFVIANTNSYFWNKFWTFNAATTGKSGSEFFEFFAVSIVGFLINNVVASSFFAVVPSDGFNAGQWGLIGAAFGSIAGLAWNFLGYKFFVFKK